MSWIQLSSEMGSGKHSLGFNRLRQEFEYILQFKGQHKEGMWSAMAWKHFFVSNTDRRIFLRSKKATLSF